MTTSNSQTQPAEISPDGLWRWDGQDWVANTDTSGTAAEDRPQGGTEPVPPTPAAVSAEGQHGNAWAIVALVMGILAVSISWIPLLNNIAPLFSVLGLLLAIPAYLRVRKWGSGKGLTIASVVLSVLAFFLVLGTQAMYSSAIDSIGDSVEQSMDDSANSLAVTLGDPTTDSFGYVTVPVTVVNKGAEDLTGGSITIQAVEGSTVISETYVSVPQLKVGQSATDKASFFEELPQGATFKVVDTAGYAF